MDENQQDFENRTVILSGEVTQESIIECINSLFTLYKKSKEPIELIVSTEGGDVIEALSLIDIIEFIKSRGVTITTIALGKVMSSGVYIFAAGTKGRRLSGKHTRFMMHGVSTETFGTLIEMKNEIRETKKLQDFLANYLISSTKLTKKQLDKMAAKCDTYFGADQAIQWNIADDLLQ